MGIYQGDLRGPTPELYTGRVAERNLVARSGMQVPVVLRQWQLPSLHNYVDIGGISYDIPQEARGNDALNTVLQSRTGADLLIPLAAATTYIFNGIPTITMIQRVQANAKYEPTSQSTNESSRAFQVLASYERIPHPLDHLLQGEGRIDWQKALIEELEETVMAARYKELRVQSGFANPHVEDDYPLFLAVRNYDQILDSIPGYAPLDSAGRTLENPAERTTLRDLFLGIRKRGIKTNGELHSAYPNQNFPVSWQKKL
jgi:hypothetical protein